MMRISIRRWAGALTAVAALLVGCGGSDTGEPAAATKTAAVISVDSRVQPESVVQEMVNAKSRSVAATPKAVVIALGALSMVKADTVPFVGPRLVGEARDVAATKSAAAMQAQWQWKDTVVGGKVAAISFSAEGAYGVRLGVLINQLPGSAILRVYTQTAPGKVYQIAGQEILQRIERNKTAGDKTDAGRTWWTPDTGEGEATLEVELPPGVAVSALNIAVPQLSHIFTNLSLSTKQEYQTQLEGAKINESDSCNLDATCHTENSTERNAVARMLFNNGGKTYLCTGTLLNDAVNSGKPYFLSANHCVSNQTVASTMQTDWFYRSSSCNSRSLSSASRKLYNGAVLLHASGSTDVSLMLLNDALPSGVVFAGWDASTITANTSVTGLHHPKGDLLKISFGTIAGQATCNATTGNEFECSGSTGNFYRVMWSQGTTEGGSSGSAIFKNNRVVATLYGGAAVCANRASSDFYGRFDVAFSAALKNWLSPAISIGSRAAVYRFYNATTGAHFFTASADERNVVVNTLPAFAYEGVAFYVYVNPASELNQVFRFYNIIGGSHFYTINPSERDYVQGNLPSFRFEGAGWYAQTSSGSGATAIYRFYRLSTGTHFYTINITERNSLIMGNPDFRYEGPAYYAWTSL